MPDKVNNFLKDSLSILVTVLTASIFGSILFSNICFKFILFSKEKAYRKLITNGLLFGLQSQYSFNSLSDRTVRFLQVCIRSLKLFKSVTIFSTMPIVVATPL